MKYQLFFVASLLLANLSLAALPEYNAPEILARANITDGYNLPAQSFLNSTSPVINNHGDVAFKLMAVEGENNQALWVKAGNEPNGKIIYVAPDERLLTEPESISDSGKIAFNLFDDGVTDGIFVIDIKSQKVDQVLAPDDQPIQFYTYPKIQNNDQILFRATDDNNDRIFYQLIDKLLVSVIAEGVESYGIKSSYLFKPAINENGMIVFKSRMGEKGQWEEKNPDSIVALVPSIDPKSPGLKLVTIARDKDSDSHSPFVGFGNSVSVAKNGAVAFMGYQQDLKKSIVLAHDNTLKTLAQEGSNDIFEIELFTPKINNLGQIVFRAKDKEGKRAIFLADESGVKKIIGEGDTVETDRGTAKILSNPNYPGIGGNVDMNDKGEIVFYSLIVNSDNKELGSGVFKITPKL